jgi:[ribosomal protein S5]-alanine N-acetyltransferase
MRAVNCPKVDGYDLILRSLELKDIEPWFEYLSLPNTLLHTSWNVSGLDELRSAIEQYNSEDPSSNIRFAVESAQDGILIGTIGFHTISHLNRTAEVAFDFHPSYWGRGFATVCCQAVVEWGFSQKRYVRIQATALESNLRSVRVLEKCGFALEGKLRNFRLVRGVPGDFWLYAKVSV